jgi:hypothetical protein
MTLSQAWAHTCLESAICSLGSRVQKSKKATVGSQWVIGLTGPPAGNILHFIDLATTLITNQHCRTLIVQRGGQQLP